MRKKATPITTPLESNRIGEIVQEWYASFVDVDQTLLFELVTAANFMDITALLDLTCLAVSVLIKVRRIHIFVVNYFCLLHIPPIHYVFFFTSRGNRRKRFVEY